MDFYDIYCNTNIIKSILSDKLNDRLSHSYIIYADNYEDIKMLTLIASSIIMCRNNGCRECRECKSVIKNNNLDVITIDKESILKDDILELINATYIKSVDDNYKVNIIIQGDKIHPIAQNKLLKTLEEPPYKNVFLIGCINEAALYDTIKSRCVKLRFNGLSNSEIKRILKQLNIKDVEIEFATVFSKGSIKKACEVADSSLINDYFKLIDIFKCLLSSKDIIRFTDNDVFSKDNITTTLSLLDILFKDMMMLSINADISIPSLKDDYEKILNNGYTTSSLTIIMEELIKTREKINFNCNLSNTIYGLLIKILEVNYKCRK